ncbi:30S ribosomal protein S20 [Lachnospiraceae bacterium oral taxon 500]|nr:30S ribosomal protein S20 [Lachnospiraceae bacterium oral taxon 500]
MANIKSAIKRIQVTERQALRNKSIKSAVKTQIKKVITAIENKDAAAAQTELKAAIKKISMAASKGIYHKNTAGRKVSRLTKLVNELGK